MTVHVSSKRVAAGLAHGVVAIAVLIFFAGIPCARACNIPVFRYALDHWRPEAYEFIVLYDADLSEANKELLDRLQKYCEQPELPANVNLTRVDLRKSRNAAWQRLSKTLTALPGLVVMAPGTENAEVPLWSGPLDEEALVRLLDSPLRRELARRFWKGDSVVWLLLETGKPEQDSPAKERVAATLTRLKKTLQLPSLTDAPQDKLVNPKGPPLRLAFSTLTLSRDDPAEAMLVRMLLHTEDGLARRKEPMVFPIFGRGIVLHALVGKGITAENIGASAQFLIGACSCQVKKLNPGVDLLVTADWENGTEPPAFRVSSSSAISTETKSAPAPASMNFTLVRNMSLAILSGLVILGFIAFMRSAARRSGRRQGMAGNQQ